MTAATSLGGYAVQQQQISDNFQTKTNPNSPKTFPDEYAQFAIFSWARDPNYGPFYHMLVEPGKY
jgi:hypothetical protein